MGLFESAESACGLFGRHRDLTLVWIDPEHELARVPDEAVRRSAPVHPVTPME